MKLRRIRRKLERTQREKVELRRLRERLARERPSADNLLRSGEVKEFIPLGSFVRLQEMLRGLKKLRESAGLSLSDVARVSKIDKAALSRLERGLQPNPKLATLERYASAVRAEIVLSFRKLRSRTKSVR